MTEVSKKFDVLCKLHDLNIQQDGVGGGALGNRPRPKFIGITVSIPTRWKTKVLAQSASGRSKMVPLAWQFLKPQQQYDFFIEEYIPKVLQKYLDTMIIVFERNKAGCLHIHLIAYDEHIQNDYDMDCLRASIRQSYLPMSMVGSNMNKHKVLNFIHYIEDVGEWLKYMSKDESQHEYDIKFIIPE